eukprot:TRINITY_DN40566_c0_g1_i1.p1 TRINITY_DN40566_c0_g1~~TRINITY_DN40566_c0_g1_i1.p1  ORF type:complete len:595 (+),score=185.12 TRINITY_DN40566_c0_g1_i1:124-1908(+)
MAAAECAQRHSSLKTDAISSPADVLATVPLEWQAVGTALAGSASFLSCFGVNMQKSAYNHEHSKPPEQRRPLLRSWRWWVGLCCMVVASAADMAALPFIPLSRVAALGSLTIVANVLICPLFLKERITRHDVLGALLTVAGTSLACVFGVTEEPELGSSCLLELFAASFFLVYFVGCVIALLLMLWVIEGFRRTKRRVLALQLGGLSSFECLNVWGQPRVLSELTTTIDDWFVFFKSMGPQFYPAVMATFGGASGAQSVTLSKAVFTFLRNAVRGHDPANSVAYLFIFLVPMIIFLFGQIRYLNEALSTYRDTLFVLPMYQSTWILMGIASGLIFYQEYRELDGVRACVFAFGVFVSLAGIKVLTSRKDVGVPAAGDSESPRPPGVIPATPGLQPDTSPPARSASSVAPADETELQMLPSLGPAGQASAASTPRASQMRRRASVGVWPPPDSEHAFVPTVTLGVGALRLRSTSVLVTEGFHSRTPLSTPRAAQKGLATPLLRSQPSPAAADASPAALSGGRSPVDVARELPLSRSSTAPSLSPRPCSDGMLQPRALVACVRSPAALGPRADTPPPSGDTTPAADKPLLPAELSA